MTVSSLPPRHLKPATKRWFGHVTENYELEQHHIRLLTLAAQAWDRAERLQDELDHIKKSRAYHLFTWWHRLVNRWRQARVAAAALTFVVENLDNCRRTPAGTVVVSGSPLLSQGNSTITLSSSTPFELGSVSKLFTVGIYNMLRSNFRGTLGVAKDAPVGFSAIRLAIDVDAEADAEQLATLRRLTERYCVVYQTLVGSPAIEMTLAPSATPAVS